MNRWILTFAAALVIGSCTFGCRTVPTTSPNDAIVKAESSAAESAGLAEVVAVQAKTIAETLDTLPVPVEVRNAARDHAADSNNAAKLASETSEQIAKLIPIVVKISEERDLAIKEIEVVKKENEKYFLAFLKLSGVLVGVAVLFVFIIALRLKKLFGV